jgi:L-aspartate oxidase
MASTAIAIHQPQPVKRSDEVLIIGGGLAGLFCALKLAPKAVTVIWPPRRSAAARPRPGRRPASPRLWAPATPSKAMSPTRSSPVTASSTRPSPHDGHRSLRPHARPARLRRTLRPRSGRPAAGEPRGGTFGKPHRARAGDMAGRAIMEALVETVTQDAVDPGARKATSSTADGRRRPGRRSGRAWPRRGRQRRANCSGSRLARGDRRRRHRPSLRGDDQPAEARGGGIGMAARAGARMADIEFVQFHPTAINVGKDPAPLATEALRGHGATLHNGRRTLHAADPPGCRTGAARRRRARHLRRGAGRPGRLSRLHRTAVADFAEEFPTVMATAGKQASTR